MIDIKIGREVYTFTEDDVFLDNGACVQCFTKSVFTNISILNPPLKMTNKALKLLDEKCERVIITTHNFSKIEGLTVFSLKLKGE